MIMVLHLGFSQCRTATGAPVDGLLAPDNTSSGKKPPEFSGYGCLVVKRHGEVWVVPLAEHAQPFELLALNVDEPFSILSAVLPDFHLSHGELLLAQFLVHLVFNWQPMAVPPRDIDSIEAAHLAALDDHVLQDLIESGPQMNVPVGVRGTIMQDVTGAILGTLPQPLVKPHLFPPRQNLRFTLGEVGLHGKVGLRQIDCRLIVHAYPLIEWLDPEQDSGTNGREIHESNAGVIQGRAMTVLTVPRIIGALDSSASPDTREF